MKNNHEIILKQYAAYCKEQPLYLGTAGSYGMEMLTIIREGVWAEYDILAAFHPPVGAAVQVRVGADNQIGVPIEATAEKGMGEIVFAGYKEGVRQIAVDVLYKVAPSSGASGTAPAEPTPDVVQQIMLAANAAEKLAQSVRDDADVGKFTGAKGDKGDIGPTGPKGERGEKGDPGKDAVIDTTLSHAGEAADAAEVGKLKEDLSNKITKFYASNQGETRLTDSDNGKIQDMVLYGKNEQNQYKGINLIPTGISYNEIIEVSIPKGTRVFWATDGTPALGGNFRFYNEDKTQDTWFGVDAGKTAMTSTIDIDVKYIEFLIDKPQSVKICLGIGDDPVYEPYTGGQPSPSPDYPQEIKSVVNPTVKVTNKDGLKVQSVTLNNITLNAVPVSRDGNVTIDGQQYVADYVDVERGKLVKMVDSSKLDNTQSIVDKTEWLLAEPQETDLTTGETTALKELVTYYPATNISVNSEQLDGYTVFNYPISMKNGWNYIKKQFNDNRDYIYDMDLQSAEAYVNSEYAVALTELEV